jgi:hypothetical protein
MLLLNRSQEIKQLLKEGAQAEKKRILGTKENSGIRQTLERQIQEQSWKPNPGNPLSWWTTEIESAYKAWISDPEPAPILYEALTPTEPWKAGQPVLITLDGQQQPTWLRLSSLNFSPRWLRGDMVLRRVDHRELTLRDPRKTWPDPFELQLGMALLCAHDRNDVNHEWLAGPYTEDEIELERLLLKAQKELDPK